jgi:mannose-6-phosphate isomerase-like protein (cupin superfamily)
MTSFDLHRDRGARAAQEIEGERTGGQVSIIIVDTDVPGSGPRLHRHPYPETFVLVTGSVHFWVGDADFIATGPSVQVAPALTPHRFRTVGPDRVHMVDVHASPRFITEWLEDGAA